MQIQYLGHSAFKLIGQDAVVLIDPFLNGNPSFTGDYETIIADVTHVCLTHMHNDHFGDTLDILKKTKAKLFAMVEIADWVEGQKFENVVASNYGGTVDLGSITATLVPAWHTSGLTKPDGTHIPGGQSAGLIIEIDGQTVYHMGDTAIFGDMALIAELYDPDIGIVPIGGHYTMDAKTAALAVDRYFGMERVIPCHYATFGLLAPNADEFVAAVQSTKVEVMAPMSFLQI